MRKIRFNCFAVLLVAVLGSCFSGFSADSAAAKKDPFTREVEKESEPGQVDEGVDNIVLDFQLIEVPQKAVFKWEQEGLNWNVWYENANDLINAGEAKILASTATLTQSGRRVQVASQLRFAYPAESDVLEIDPKGPPFPAAFEFKNLGLILMADPVLASGRKHLNMSYLLESSAYGGENFETRFVSARIEDSDVVSPKFQVNKISNSVDFEIGVYRMLTQFESETKGNVVLVFARFDLITAAPLEDKKKMADLDGIRLRSSWVEMPADMWHDWLRGGSLRTLFGGEAWNRVSEQIEQGNAGVKVVGSPTLSCPSGQRGKVEAISETTTSFRDFRPPQVFGGVCEPKGTEIEKIGVTLEVDPVLGANGIVNLNLASSSTSACGRTVSYRHEENGKWVPSISHLKIFEDVVTTMVSLDEGMQLLTGVMTPSHEDGSLDYSRKLLFFIRNETFQSP